MSNAISATVTSITGRAFARNAGGELRELRPGDVLQEGEILVTPDGGQVQLALSDGSSMSVSDVGEMAISRDLIAETASGSDESAVQDETVKQVLSALESGEDINDALQAPAAGPAAVGEPAQEGHSWVRLSRIVETTSEFTGVAGSHAAETVVVVDEELLQSVDAIDDAATTDEGVPVVIHVQDNDKFGDGSIVTAVTNGLHGTVVINSDNTVTYIPNPGFIGTDTFTYTAVSIDGVGSDSAVVTVVIEGEAPPPPPPPPEPPTLSISDDIVIEGETATLTISLSKPWTETVTVQYHSTDGSAVAPGDYDPVTGMVTVTFAPGETSKTITVSTNEDNLKEGTEQFFIKLVSPTNATIADDTGVVTITDDYVEPPPPKPPEEPPREPPNPRPGALSVTPGSVELREENLASGTHPNLNEGGITRSGTFTVVAEDGLRNLSVTADSGTANVVVNGAFVAGTSVIEEGVVKITFDSISGPDAQGRYTVHVTATLLGDFQHTGADAEQVTLNFGISIKDINGDTASAVRTAIVVDDAPIAVADSDKIIDDDTSVTGNVITGASEAGTGGADALGADHAAVTGVTGLGVEAPDDGNALTATGKYGTLVMLANGTYTYTRTADAAVTGTDVFTYTLTDSDGDISTATLTISLDGGVSINLPPESGVGSASVDEAGLPVRGSETAGSAESATVPDDVDSETTSGTFTYTAADAPVTITIDGKLVVDEGVLIADAFITTDKGVLEITWIDTDTQTVSYRYTLTDNTSGEDTSDSFAVQVKDADGDTASGNLVITIVDDVPVAYANVNSVTEGGLVSGNVLTDGTADVFGADGPVVTGGVVGVKAGDDTGTPASGGLGGTGIVGLYGTLILNADGSYSYDGAPNVVPPEGATDTFVYTIEDGDGDLSTTTLTITLTDSGMSASSDHIVVSEAALSSGSNPASTAETAASTLVGNVTGGTGGYSYTLVGSGDGTYGTLTLNPNGTYSYTLDTRYDTNPDVNNGANVESNRETFTYKATDGNGNTVTNTITIDIVDDVPIARADVDQTVSGAAAGNVILGTGMTGGVADTAGADGFGSPAVVGVSTSGAVSNGTGVGIAVASAKGTLTLNADGSYTYAKTNAAATGTDVFHYTIKDGDGDTSTATLTINLDSNPTISNLTPEGAGGDVVVDEDDLLAARGPGESAGSDTTKESTTQAGNFTITAGDGVGNLSIGGHAFITNGIFTAGSFTTALGNTLSGTGYNAATGVVSYTYTLNDNETHAPGGGENDLFENFAVHLTDTDTGTADSTLSVRIVDDAPTAQADVDKTVSGSAAGNVILGTGMTGGVADIRGADGLANPAVVGVSTSGAVTDGTGVGMAVASAKGTLTLNADGSYTYTKTDAAATGTDVFHYTIKDADGDTSTTTLTINLDSNPTISNLTPQGLGGDVVVDEDDLLAARGPGESAGSDTTKESTTQAGTFTITAGDGVGNLSIGGHEFITNGVFTAGSFTTDLGNTLSVTGYNAATGVVSYTYTLNDNEAHAPGGGENDLFENFAVHLTDTDTGTADSTLSVRIVDDAPTAQADVDKTASGSADGNVILGTGMTGGVADIRGADGLASPAVVGVSTSGAVTDGSGVGIAVASAKGTLTLNADGSFSYTKTDAAATGTDVFHYTIKDADGDTSTTTLTINLDSNPSISNLTPQGSGGDVVVDEDDLLAARGPGEFAGSDTSKESTTQAGTFTITAGDGVGNLSIGGHTFITNGVFTAGSFTTDLGNTLSVTGYNPANGVVSYTYTLVDNEAHAPGGGENDLFENFNVHLTDTDTGSADSTLSVRIVDDAPIAQADVDKTVSGTADGNVILGTGMTGGVADIGGADGLASPAVVGVSTSPGSVTDGTGVGSVIHSAKGDLTLGADGSFTYTKTDANATGTDVFHYTIKDADGDTSTTTLTINLDSNPKITNLTPQASGGDVVVDEDDLLAARGAGESAGTDTTKESTTQSGTFNITAGDGVGSLSIDGHAFITNGTFTGGSFTTGMGNTLAVTGYNAATGVVSYAYTLNDNEAHPTGNGENSLFENFSVHLTDTDTGVADSTLSVRIVDDVPQVLANQHFTITSTNTNIMIVLDMSSSMDSASGIGSDTRMKAATDAIKSILDAYGTQGDVAVRLVTFGTSGGTIGSTWMDVATAKSSLPTPFAGNGNTNYDAALTQAESAFATPTGKIDGAQNLLFFFSDGFPNLPSGDVGIDAGEQAQWENFLTNNDIASFAIAMGNTNEVSAAQLQPIAFNGQGGAPIDAIQTSFVDLKDVVLGLAHNVAGNLYGEGNAVTAVAGADGVGSIIVSIDGVNYTYNPDLNQITNSQNATVVLGSALTVHTALGGTWTINMTSGAYTYLAGANLTAGTEDVMNYTLVDRDGDPSSATVTVEINPPFVVDTFVSEDDLLASRGLNEAVGSDATKESTTQAGTFTMPAGNSVASMSIDGHAFVTNGVFTAGSYTTALGNTLNVTAYNAVTGVVSYTYTLADNEAHAAGAGNNELLEDLAVHVVEKDSGVVEGIVSVHIVDDVPVVGDFVDFTVPNAAGPTAGPTNAGFLSGADHWSSINITGEAISGLSYLPLVVSKDDNGHVISTTLTAVESGSGDKVFSYTVTADGQQSFDLIKPEASSVVTVDLANLASGGPINLRELADYSVEFEGGGINVSTPGIGLGNNTINPGETFAIEFFKPGQGTAANDDLTAANANLVGSVSFTDGHQGGTYSWTAYNTLDGTFESGTTTMAGGAAFTIDPTIDFDRIEMTATDGSMRPNNMSFTQLLLPDGMDITFNVTGTDNDGDVTATDNVTVTVSPGVHDVSFPAIGMFSSLFTQQDSAANEPSQDDTVPAVTLHTATADADTLVATNGADNFAWSLADHTAQGDTIVGFNTDADSINIADLLPDSVNTTDFSSYLDVSLDGASTVLKVSGTGDFEHADQVITVQDVNLFEGVDFSDSAALSTALQNMVDQGKLITD